MTMKSCGAVTALLFAGMAHGQLLKFEQACTMLNLYDIEEYRRGLPVSIRLWNVKALPNYRADRVEKLRETMAKQLERELQKTKFFGKVAIIADDAAPAAGYLLTGEFREIDAGSRSRRVLGVGGAAALGAIASLWMGPKHDKLLADFECLSHDQGGWSGLAGAEGSTQNNAEDIAESLADRVDEAAKRAAEQNTQSKFKVIKGEMAGTGGSLLAKPLRGLGTATKLNPMKLSPFGRKSKDKTKNQNLEADRSEGAETVKQDSEARARADAGTEEDDGDVVVADDDDTAEDDEEVDVSRKDEERRFTSVLSRGAAGRKPRREVYAVWITSRAYDAHRKLAAKPAKPRELKRTQSLLGGLTPAAPHLAKLENEDAYVIAVSFLKTEIGGPIFWDFRAFEKNTVLRADGREIRPLRVIDAPVPPNIIVKGKLQIPFNAHTVLLAFPTRGPDGKPLVRHMKEELELHTVFDRHPVVLPFDLDKAPLTEPEELTMLSRGAPEKRK